MKARQWLLMMFTSAAVTGCQSLHVQSAHDHNFAFADLHSFCWVAPAAYLYNDPRLKMDQLEPLVREDVEQQLHAHGFVSTDCAAADFQVTFRAALRDRIAEGRSPDDEGGGVTVYEYNPETGGQWWTSRSGGTVNVEREGSLIILVMQPKTGKVIWNGSASASLRSQATPEQRKQRLEKVVSQIMQQFPPTAKK
jgi:hypothetical protein